MKYGMMVLLAGGLLVLGGCQNKELIQCQADQEQMKAELEQQKASVSELMDMNIKDTAECNQKIEQANAETAAVKEAQKEDWQKLDNAVKAMLKKEEEKKQLEGKVAEMEKSLANAADMSKAQADENAQLKAKIADLEAQLEAAKAAAAAAAAVPAPAPAPAAN